MRILFPVKPLKIRALFSDIGGVLGTNGWDTALRQKVTARFGVDPVQAEALHHLMFDSYERGYISFNTYLQKSSLVQTLPSVWKKFATSY